MIKMICAWVEVETGWSDLTGQKGEGRKETYWTVPLVPNILELIGSLSGKRSAILGWESEKQSKCLPWECGGETALAQEHAPIMGQPCFPLASTASNPTHPCTFEMEDIHFLTREIYDTKSVKYILQKNDLTIMGQPYLPLASTASSNPTHPCAP